MVFIKLVLVMNPKTKEEVQSEKIKKSLLISIFEGSFWSVMIGLGEKYLSAFAVFLKATNTQIGLLASLPILFSSLSQFFSPNLIEKFKSRKKFVVSGVLINAFSWLLILSVFYLGKYKVYYLILFVTIYWVAGAIPYPAWNSWMGDLVSSEHRGTYFGRRTKITVLIILIFTAFGGLILDYFKTGLGKPYLGFVAVFLIAMLARMGSAFLMSKQYEPEMAKAAAEDKFGFFEFLKQAPFRNYGLYTIFLTLMNFAVYISAPFFTAYMLYDLHFSYTRYMIILSVPLVAKYFSLPIWGKFSDKYGNKKIMSLTGYLMPVVPLLWIFSTNYYFLIFAEIFSGVVWAGFDLSTLNFIFDSTTPQKRARCVSYLSVVTGIMVFLGTMLGSVLIEYNNLFWTKYYLAFLVSGVLRAFIAAILLPRIKERRKVTEISYEQMAYQATRMIVTKGISNVLFILTFPKNYWENRHQNHNNNNTSEQIRK